jgi:2-polyprenyl-6-methoxyphenol hydroxylase-like FAD-dependent oxidoreductase
MSMGSISARKAIVIGAGMGGLCTALALQKAGWLVDIYDKASSLNDVGAGIVLAANAIKALEKLGVASEIIAESAPVGTAEIRTWDGKLLVNLPVEAQAKRYGTYSYVTHRANLQAILYNRLDHTTHVLLNKKLLTYEQDENGVTAVFADGSRGEGDVLIGADGIHSTVRQIHHGTQPLRYAGYTALRGVCSFHNQRYSIEDGGGFEAWGPGKRFGFSQLGQGRAFWFAAINSAQGMNIPLAERKNAAQQYFRGWYKPVEAVIESTDPISILSHDIFDHSPLSTWSRGRVTLLGDAAHPMMPNLGQGGAQAMEDAIILAQCLQGYSSDVSAAMLEYERRRIPRTTNITHQSRQMGRMAQLENQFAIRMRNILLQSVPSWAYIRRMHKVIGYEV